MTAACPLTPAQRAMLGELARWTAAEERRLGRAPQYLEAGALVAECSSGYAGGLAWRIADRTFGALTRRGLVESHPHYGDLIRVSPAGRAALAALEAPPAARL